MVFKNTRKKTAIMSTIAEVHQLLLELQKEQQISNGKIDELLKEIKDKDNRIRSLESKVEALEGEVELLKNTSTILERKSDDNEQYSRRMSLRITNIPSGGKETGEQSVDLVVDTLKRGVSKLKNLP